MQGGSEREEREKHNMIFGEKTNWSLLFDKYSFSYTVAVIKKTASQPGK